MKLTERFENAADAVSDVVGKPAVFFLCCMLIVAWAASGPLLKFSDTWQLIINTSTTIITFLMVFLIQSSQTRNDKAVHAKLDELVRTIKDARPEYAGLEKKPEGEIDGAKDKAEEGAKASG